MSEQREASAGDHPRRGSRPCWSLPVLEGTLIAMSRRSPGSATRAATHGARVATLRQVARSGRSPSPG